MANARSLSLAFFKSLLSQAQDALPLTPALTQETPDGHRENVSLSTKVYRKGFGEYWAEAQPLPTSGTNPDEVRYAVTSATRALAPCARLHVTPGSIAMNLNLAAEKVLDNQSYDQNGCSYDKALALLESYENAMGSYSLADHQPTNDVKLPTLPMLPASYKLAPS